MLGRARLLRTRTQPAVRAAGHALAALLWFGQPALSHAEVVQFANADGTRIDAHWFKAQGPGPRPAVIALHGCGGLYRRDGKTLDARYPEYTAHLNRAGYHVLLPDSFGSRGSGPICTVKRGERPIDVRTRRGDALAAVAWAATQPEVDAGRIALLGWSNGATTALAVIDTTRTDAPRLAAAVVFYPGCNAFLKTDFRVDVPLLMLLGAKDDWTPPEPCVRLAERMKASQPAGDLMVEVYPDSVHGFDSARPVRFRSDVPNGVHRAGVHQGGNPAARAQSRQDMDAFLARTLR